MATYSKPEALRRQAHYDRDFAGGCFHYLTREGAEIQPVRAVAINFYLQAAEKSLKAMGLAIGCPVKMTHSVVQDLFEKSGQSKLRSFLTRQLSLALLSELRALQGLVPSGDESQPNVEYPFGQEDAWQVPAEYFGAATVKRAARVSGAVVARLDKLVQSKAANRLSGEPSDLLGDLRARLLP